MVHLPEFGHLKREAHVLCRSSLDANVSSLCNSISGTLSGYIELDDGIPSCLSSQVDETLLSGSSSVFFYKHSCGLTPLGKLRAIKAVNMKHTEAKLQSKKLN